MCLCDSHVHVWMHVSTKHHVRLLAAFTSLMLDSVWAAVICCLLSSHSYNTVQFMLISVQYTDTAERCRWLVFLTDIILMLTAFQIADNTRPDLWTWSWVWVLAQRDRLLDEMTKCWSLLPLSLYLCLFSTLPSVDFWFFSRWVKRCSLEWFVILYL